MINHIGFTSSIPVEIIYAAGLIPCDLNNLFIGDPHPGSLIEQAEESDFPATSCAWIKGIYSTIKKHGIRKVVAVVSGDCSSTHALAEVLEYEGVEIIPFAFPLNRNPKAMEQELEEFRRYFRVSRDKVKDCKRNLDAIRRQLEELDRLIWEEGRVSGEENHRFLVSASDFSGSPKHFSHDLNTFLQAARRRQPKTPTLRLGIIGVPPIISNFYPVIKELGVEVVFNEVQRQFSMPGAGNLDLAGQYLAYTYPYAVSGRIADIKAEIDRRRIDGIIHYVQSFCFRQIEDIIIKKELPVPVLTIEGDRPAPVDGRTITRLETFIEMLQGRQKTPHPHPFF
ncbi:MAG: 2-hydroxyacyl-CoA dehydratase family protein [Pseudomonadota bacterium]|nr:2-hydroxyacyl-CoA dehydratase family protein [Pseudomonadota bacterium]